MSKWTKDWPKEVGDYWFYGWRFGDVNQLGKRNKPDMHRVRAVKDSDNNITLITCKEGQFLFQQEGAKGAFLKIILNEPSPPAFFKKEFIKRP